ncbi:MAG: hypothetical protein LAQ30_01675 [Acidobacteriia bacterium]|nr:hypothetical protein [Terriglobia bacterium]
MRTEAISAADRCKIIHRLAESHGGAWKAMRRGANIQIARFRAGQGNRIEWSVSQHARLCVGTAATIGEAADQVNRIVAAGARAYPPAAVAEESLLCE